MIAVFLIDRLLEKKEEARKAPIKYVVYQEISVVYNRFVNLLLDLYANACPEPAPLSIGEFLADGFLERAFLYTNVEAQANVFPARLVHEYLNDQAKDLRDRAEKIIDKYSAFMEPSALSLLYGLFLNSSFMMKVTTLSKIIEARRPWPYPQSLGYHLGGMTEREVSDLQTLEKWLFKERRVLVKRYTELRQIVIPGRLPQPGNPSLPFRLEEEVLQTQIARFDAWRLAQQKGG
jgi:hypothetical protein